MKYSVKAIFFLISAFGLGFSTFAQTGPGGVGNASDNRLWLDASSLSLSNGDPVQTWTDISGNANDAFQNTAALRPTFLSSSINGKPALDFAGKSDVLQLTNHLTEAALTFFAIYQADNTGAKGILQINKHYFLGRHVDVFARYNGVTNSIRKSNINPALFTVSSSSIANSSYRMTVDNIDQNFSRTNFNASANSSIGGRLVNSNSRMDGRLAEIILYNRQLNLAEYNIVSNYLAAKYNVDAVENLYSYKSTHGNSLIGLGAEASGSNTSATDFDGDLSIFNASSLGNGDYLLIAHDNGGFSTSSSVPSGFQERWNRVWRAGVTGSPGSIDIEVFLKTNGFAANTDYVILVDDDGNFTNGGTTAHATGRTFNAGNNSISFSGLSLSDGDYFTLAEVQGDITSVNSGDWGNPATWDCTCIPDTSDVANIVSPHTVDVNSNASIADLTVESGATLNFGGSDTLKVFRDLDFDAGSSFIRGNGTIAALSLGSDQEFANNSGTRIEFNNLYVDNNLGLDLTSGGWAIHNNLQVVSGGMDVSAADSIVMISNSSKTSQILQSMNGAFSGDFIMQRYIGARNANYGNLGSTVEDATIADLDDDLFLSGVGGNNGNAAASGGGIFYSVWTYYPFAGQNGSIQSTSAPLNPGQGYEVYLASTQTSFNATTIDYVGVPNTGELPLYMLTQKGWNLFANQFHAHVAYDSVEKVVWVPDEYYIFNTDNGSYDLITGSGKPLLAPGQGFWINSSSGGKAFEFKEEDKVPSTSSTFLRTAENKSPYFNLEISNDQNPFKHKMSVDFAPTSMREIDEKDSYFLESPIDEAPALYSFASNDEQKLVRNSLNSLESSHLVPVSVDAGVEGNYSIQTENIESLLDNYSCVYLKDNANGKVTDLSVEPQYEFFAQAGESNRFDLLVSNSYEECQKLIEEGEFIQDLNDQLRIRNVYGEVYLDYTFDNNQHNVELEIFKTNGQMVKGTQRFSAAGAGTYLIRELQDLKGIYLIRIKTNDQFVNKTVKL